MDDKDTQSETKLPVWDTLGAAYAAVFRRPGALFSLAIIPLVISIAGEMFVLSDPTGAIAGLAASLGPGAAEGLGVFVGFLTTYLPWGGFVVAWHRFVLLDERASRRPVALYLGSGVQSCFKNELFLVVVLVGLFFVSVTVSLLALDFPPGLHEERLPFSLPILALAVVTASRLSFQEPALAIGCTSDIPTAWRQSRGVGWKQFWILLLAPLPFILLELLLGWPHPAAAKGSGLLGVLAAVIAQRLVLFLGTAVIVAALCVSYRRVVHERDRGRVAPTSASEWVTGFVLPIALGLGLGAAAASVAGMLRLSVDAQVLSAAAAFLIPLLVKMYHFAATPPKHEAGVEGSKEPRARP